LANTGDSAESIRIRLAPASEAAEVVAPIATSPSEKTALPEAQMPTADSPPAYFKPSLSIPEKPQTSSHPLAPPTLWSLRPYSLGGSLDPMEKAIAGFPDF